MTQEHRTTATSIAYMGGNMGAAFGFLLGPFIINGEPNKTALLLYWELGMAAVLLVCALCYCPDRPKHKMSEAVKLCEDPEVGNPTLGEFFRSVGQFIKIPSLVVLMVIGGIEAGSSSAWGGVLPQILSNANYPSKFGGVCGFAGSIAGMIGTATSGIIADRFFRKNLKALLAIWFYFAALAYGLGLPGNCS